jgi:ABC-type polysaccharide/polyol phosphate transport system ATPase subunit
VSNLRASAGPEASAVERSAVIVADGVSKRYPGRPMTMFPPVVSMFQRNLFRRDRSSEDTPRRRQRAEDDFEDEDDDELEDEDEEEFEERLPPPRAGPDEMFWALKDVSFRVPPGSALGVLGGSGAGKSTLLRILGGAALPTEGRVLVRGRVAPLATRLVRALKITDKGTFNFELVFASRLTGVEPRVVKRHKAEIEELAQPLWADGEPAPGWATRLSLATAAVLPSNVILLEEEPGVDEVFTAQIVERIRERVQAGSALVFASHKPGLVGELCDEVIVLEEGSIIDRGAAQGAVHRYEVTEGDGSGSNGRRLQPGTGAATGLVWQGRKLQVPATITPFNACAALLSARVRTPSGARSKRVDAADELAVEIRIETALEATTVQCAVDFTPANDDQTVVRLERPEPLRCAEPGTHALLARIPPGTLRDGLYGVRVDAIVWSATERTRTVIARDAGRIRIVGDELDAAEPAAEPAPHWDGRATWRAEAQWSVE